MEKKLGQTLRDFAAVLTDSFGSKIERVTAFGPLLLTDRPRDGTVNVMIVFSHPVSGAERIQVIKLAGAVSKINSMKEGARRVDFATDCVSRLEYDTYINSCSPHWKKARSGTTLFCRELLAEKSRKPERAEKADSACEIVSV